MKPVRDALLRMDAKMKSGKPTIVALTRQLELFRALIKKLTGK
jgi:hypothetical protein